MKKGGARLGQHFLKHAWAARALAHAVTIRPGETFLEIGPGKGILTKELLQLGSVVAIEKDPPLVEHLKDQFAQEINEGRLKLIEDDVRNVHPGSLGLPAYVVAANIPYYITGEIIRQFLEADAQPRAMALLVQKEVAKRVVDTKESILSISVKAYGVPSIAAKVPRSHFSPPPSVDSAILVIDNISKDFFADISEGAFFKIVKAGFASKRKFLANNLSAILDRARTEEAMARAGVSEKARAEDVTLENWKALARRLAS